MREMFVCLVYWEQITTKMKRKVILQVRSEANPNLA